MILETRIQDWTDEADCATSAAALALRPGVGGAFIELHGPLGAGKTTFVRHLLGALGVAGRVKSPTYAVLESYQVASSSGDPAGLPIHHFDFYRFDDPQEWQDAGFRDIFAGAGLKLAEWPEMAGELLPPADLRLFIDPGDGADGRRRVRLVACSPLGVSLLSKEAS